MDNENFQVIKIVVYGVKKYKKVRKSANMYKKSAKMSKRSHKSIAKINGFMYNIGKKTCVIKLKINGINECVPKANTPSSFPMAEQEISRVNFCIKNKKDKLKKDSKLSQKAVDLCLNEDKSAQSPERRKNMINVRDAANYFVRLYYYGNMKCTSASIQKLLFIAQLLSLRSNNKPLFDESFLIKPSCFSISLISDTYSDKIFNDDSRESLSDEYNDSTRFNVPNFDIENGILSSFYDFFEFLIPNDDIDVMRRVYEHFGGYSGKCIGDYMVQLTLHDKNNLYQEVSVSMLNQYLMNIPEKDLENPIIRFINT